MLLLPVSLLVLLGQLSALPSDLYTASELIEIFEDTIQKRDGVDRALRFSAFGENVELNLKRSTEFLPDYLPVHFLGVGENGERVIDDFSHETASKPLYGDVKTQASLMVHDVDGPTTVIGTVLGKYIIEPEPETQGIAQRSNPTARRHRIYKTNVTSLYEPFRKHIEDSRKANLNKNMLENIRNTEKRQGVPSKIWVAVQAVSDFSHFSRMQKSKEDATTYMKILFHTAHIAHFATMTNPTCQLQLNGVTICEHYNACSELNGGLLGPGQYKFIMNNVKRFAYQERGRTGTDYAIMVVMTSNAICHEGTCDGIAGWASGQACGEFSDYYKEALRDGMMIDKGGYDGVKGIGHEVGHMLNMPHDDNNACTGQNYIMWQQGWSENNFRFSSCSMEKLREKLRSGAFNCLKRPAAINHIDGWRFSNTGGRYMNYDEQCRRTLGQNMRSCHRFDQVNQQACKKLGCNQGHGGCTEHYEPPAEGTYCGPGHSCHRGICRPDAQAEASSRIGGDGGSGGGQTNSGGQSGTRDDECRAAWGSDHINCIDISFKNDKACNTLGCKPRSRDWCGEGSRQAPDGTPCGPGNTCRGGRCI